MTKTDICNKALTLNGASPIVNLDDDTNNARILNRVYDLSLRSILSETCWNFATKRKLLASVDVTLDWYHTGENYTYARPSDAVRLFEASDRYATWREEGDYILSDTAGLGIKYVHYIDSPSRYTAAFIEAFSDLLASNIAFMVLNSKSQAEAMLQKYEALSLPKARSENAQVGMQQEVHDDAWERAKWGTSIDA